LASKLVESAEQEQMRAAAESFLNGSLIGHNCRIGPHAWCANPGPRANIRLGDAVVCRGILRSEIFRHGRITIGAHVYIGDDCIVSCAHCIDIGPWTLLAHGVQVFDNDSHPTDTLSRERDYRAALEPGNGERQPIAGAPIRIGERAWIGLGAIVLKGVVIGDGAIVASGSVVTADVPPYTVVAGNPARPVRDTRN